MRRRVAFVLRLRNYTEIPRGGGGTADSMRSKRIVRKDVWVRIPPAASSGAFERRICQGRGSRSARTQRLRDSAGHRHSPRDDSGLASRAATRGSARRTRERLHHVRSSRARLSSVASGQLCPPSRHVSRRRVDRSNAADVETEGCPRCRMAPDRRRVCTLDAGRVPRQQRHVIQVGSWQSLSGRVGVFQAAHLFVSSAWTWSQASPADRARGLARRARPRSSPSVHTWSHPI
jgi:hypothetical protein